MFGGQGESDLASVMSDGGGSRGAAERREQESDGGKHTCHSNANDDEESQDGNSTNVHDVLGGDEPVAMTTDNMPARAGHDDESWGQVQESPEQHCRGGRCCATWRRSQQMVCKRENGTPPTTPPNWSASRQAPRLQDGRLVNGVLKDRLRKETKQKRL